MSNEQALGGSVACLISRWVHSHGSLPLRFFVVVSAGENLGAFVGVRRVRPRRPQVLLGVVMLIAGSKLRRALQAV